ncbi:unnamed protein product [Caenorhabditis brenneri]
MSQILFRRSRRDGEEVVRLSDPVDRRLATGRPPTNGCQKSTKKMSQKDNKGVIRIQIDDFAELKEEQENDPVEIGNAEWIFGAFSSTSDATNNVKSLGVYLKCNNSMKMNKVVGIHEKILETFEKQIDNLADVVLIVEGKKCHVAKQLLAIHSEHFKAMFYGGFEENSKKEIVIEVQKRSRNSKEK